MNNEELELKILASVDMATSQKSLANEIGHSVGKVNYVLNSLIDKGFVKVENFVNSKNKLQYRYLLTPSGIHQKIEITKKFIGRKKSEYEELQRMLEKFEAKV